MNLYIVTGTTKGLGAALAERIAMDAANELIAVARAPAGPVPGGARIEADLAEPAQLARACELMQARIDGKPFDKAVLINNAGVVSPVGPLDEVDAGELERNLAVNLVAPMLLMRWFLRATSGVALRRIINISSGAARRPIAGWSGYCTAKAGLDMASRTVALECAGRGMAVEVVSLAPGVIDTPMQAVVRDATAATFPDVERFRTMKAEGVLRAPDDVAADILRLEASGGLQGDPVQDLRALA